MLHLLKAQLIRSQVRDLAMMTTDFHCEYCKKPHRQASELHFRNLRDSENIPLCKDCADYFDVFRSIPEYDSRKKATEDRPLLHRTKKGWSSGRKRCVICGSGIPSNYVEVYGVPWCSEECRAKQISRVAKRIKETAMPP